MQLLKSQRFQIVLQHHRLKIQVVALQTAIAEGRKAGPNEPSEYCNMMSDQEKYQLINIHRMQVSFFTVVL